jgi:hypothetical protein
MVEEIREEGERRVKLTSGGYGALAFASVFKEPSEDFALDDIPSKPFDFDLLFREVHNPGLQHPHGSEEPSWITADDLDLPVSDSGRPHVPLETPCPYDASSESAISDNARTPHTEEEPPCEGEATSESSVNDNAIRVALEHLERGLSDG